MSLVKSRGAALGIVEPGPARPDSPHGITREKEKEKAREQSLPELVGGAPDCGSITPTKDETTERDSPTDRNQDISHG